VDWFHFVSVKVKENVSHDEFYPLRSSKCFILSNGFDSQ